MICVSVCIRSQYRLVSGT